MKRAVLALLTVLLAVTACSSPTRTVGGKPGYVFKTATPLGTVIPVKDRLPAGTFTGDLLNGGSIGTSDLKGKVALLNFWASWCEPCKVESPQLDLLYRRVKSKDVEFLGIDTKDAKSSAQAFVDAYHLSYPIAFDENGEIAIRLGDLPARGLPFTVLLDKSGDVAAVYLGELTAKDLQRPLDTLRAERAPA
jgi:peroxiredoxin